MAAGGVTLRPYEQSVTYSSSVITRAACEQAAADAVRKWAEALGVSSAWTFRTVLSTPDKDEHLDGNQAAVHMDHVRRTAKVLFHERLKPDWYEQKAAHECLHVLFAPLKRAIDEQKAPAMILMGDELHAAIHRLACVLVGVKPPRDNEDELMERVPWEAERGG
jgi:hypothetical protein